MTFLEVLASQHYCSPEQFYERVPRLPTHQTGGPPLASFEPDENSERDYLERTGSENLAARLWRLPPGSANTLHKHVRQEEFYFVLEGTGRLRVGDHTLTVPKYGGVLVSPDQIRQVFNDTQAEVLWLVIGAPEELEFLPTAGTKPDMSLIYPSDPKQLPKELEGAQWPPQD